jgi:hypothetical protein
VGEADGGEKEKRGREKKRKKEKGKKKESCETGTWGRRGTRADRPDIRACPPRPFRVPNLVQEWVVADRSIRLRLPTGASFFDPPIRLDKNGPGRTVCVSPLEMP